jgi:hypothetical protein
MDLEGDKKDIINREIKFFRDLHKVRPCLMGFYVFQIAEEVIIFILWGIWTYCYWSVFMTTWGNLVVLGNNFLFIFQQFIEIKPIRHGRTLCKSRKNLISRLMMSFLSPSKSISSKPYKNNVFLLNFVTTNQCTIFHLYIFHCQQLKR